MILVIIGKYDEQFIQFRELSSWDYKAVSLFVSMRDVSARISWTGTFFRVSLRKSSGFWGFYRLSQVAKRSRNFASSWAIFLLGAKCPGDPWISLIGYVAGDLSVQTCWTNDRKRRPLFAGSTKMMWWWIATVLSITCLRASFQSSLH